MTPARIEPKTYCSLELQYRPLSQVDILWVRDIWTKCKACSAFAELHNRDQRRDHHHH